MDIIFGCIGDQARSATAEWHLDEWDNLKSYMHIVLANTSRAQLPDAMLLILCAVCRTSPPEAVQLRTAVFRPVVRQALAGIRNIGRNE